MGRAAAVAEMAAIEEEASYHQNRDQDAHDQRQSRISPAACIIRHDPLLKGTGQERCSRAAVPGILPVDTSESGPCSAGESATSRSPAWWRWNFPSPIRQSIRS